MVSWGKRKSRFSWSDFATFRSFMQQYQLSKWCYNCNPYWNLLSILAYKTLFHFVGYEFESVSTSFLDIREGSQLVFSPVFKTFYGHVLRNCLWKCLLNLILKSMKFRENPKTILLLGQNAILRPKSRSPAYVQSAWIFAKPLLSQS